MRRGLMAWSRDEIGAAVFEQRVAALVAGMGARAWDCVLAYTDLTRPAAVSALTHFIPYWSNGVLVVSPSTGATLVTTLSRRVADWMHSTARLDGLVNTLDLGTGVAECLPKANGAVMRVGVVELASLPCSVAAAIRKTHPNAQFEDASNLLATALVANEAPGGAVEERCKAIAATALAAGSAAAASHEANAVVAAAEGAARNAGAEEILLALATDAAADPRLRRIEGGAALGQVFALQATVAYKGCWVRLGRTATTGPPLPWIAETDAWFEILAGEITAGALAGSALDAALPRLAGASLDFWRVEAVRAGLALAAVAGSAPFPDRNPPPASLFTLSLRLRRPQGWWFGATPLRVAPTACPGSGART